MVPQERKTNITRKNGQTYRPYVYVWMVGSKPSVAIGINPTQLAVYVVARFSAASRLRRPQSEKLASMCRIVRTAWMYVRVPIVASACKARNGMMVCGMEYGMLRLKQHTKATSIGNPTYET